MKDVSGADDVEPSTSSVTIPPTDSSLNVVQDSALLQVLQTPPGVIFPVDERDGSTSSNENVSSINLTSV